MEGVTFKPDSFTLQLLEQEDYNTVRIQIGNGVFKGNTSYVLSYDGTGTLTDRSPSRVAVPSWNYFNITNYSQYEQVQIAAAQVPIALPSTLVLMFNGSVHNIDISKIHFSSLSSTAKIKTLVSPLPPASATTCELTLDTVVQASAQNLKVALEEGAALDDLGQSVMPAANFNVVNYYGGDDTVIPSKASVNSDGRTLEVMMNAAVSVGGQVSGEGNPGGWAVHIGGHTYTDIVRWSLSDGTFTFILAEVIYRDDANLFIMYNGSGGVEGPNGIIVTAFTVPVVNGSQQKGIAVGGLGRNLAVLILGANISGSYDLNHVLSVIHDTIAHGNINNIGVGDYFDAPISSTIPFKVASYLGQGQITMYSNVDMIDGATVSHGKYMRWMVVGIDSFLNLNGNTKHHIVFQTQNVLTGVSTGSPSEGVNFAGPMSMNDTAVNTTGYNTSKLRTYLLENMMTGLKGIGFPFESVSWLYAPARRISKGGSVESPGYDMLSDLLFIPTAYEMVGANTLANTHSEVGFYQGRLGYYGEASSLIKYGFSTVNVSPISYWLSTPTASNATSFVGISGTGVLNSNNANSTIGVAPCFCISE
jgi:hypothetical protein